MSIKLLTLKTNHTIIGQITQEGDVYKVKQPVQVVSVPPKSQTDSGGIAFAPFCEYAIEFKTGLTIKTTDVLIEATPVVELENQYNQIFGSGIEIASTIPKI
jgi:hypothetical protein